MVHALTGTSGQRTGGVTQAESLHVVDDRSTGSFDGQDQTVKGTSRRGRIRRSIQTIGRRTAGVVATAVAVALFVGMTVTPASAQTQVNEGVPLKPVDIRLVQQQGLDQKGDSIFTMRSGNRLQDHLSRGALTYPFLGMMEPPTDGSDAMNAMAHRAMWRMISVAAEEAEGSAELTNFIPTTPVAGELLWRPTLKDGDREVDVLPLLLPQIANTDGSINMDRLKELFLRVNNPSPRSDADGVFLAENVGFKNGRAGYFSINSINPEPLQPHDASGNLLLPQLTLEVNGHKTVYTIGSLCYKGGGPSFQPDGSFGGGYGYNRDRQKTPLNMEETRPIYSGGTTFGLFDYEKDAKTNENGWMLLEHGAYAGMSIMQFRLDELVDYQLDGDKRPVGEPGPISVEQLQKDGRVSSSSTPSLLWRAFETEYRLSSFKNVEESGEVLAHMQQLFARDAVFDYIANDATLSGQWEAATAKGRGGDTSDMTTVWTQAIEGLNAVIKKGDHHLKDPITVTDGVASMTIDDYVRSAIQRSARNVVVLHKLGLDHGSIAAGGDNINAAWQMVDLDHLSDAYSTLGADPKDHPDVSEFTSNLEMMVDDLKDRVPELAKYEDQMRDLLKQAIDREAPIYGRQDQPSQGDG